MLPFCTSRTHSEFVASFLCWTTNMNWDPYLWGTGFLFIWNLKFRIRTNIPIQSDHQQSLIFLQKSGKESQILIKLPLPPVLFPSDMLQSFILIGFYILNKTYFMHPFSCKFHTHDTTSLKDLIIPYSFQPVLEVKNYKNASYKSSTM